MLKRKKQLFSGFVLLAMVAGFYACKCNRKNAESEDKEKQEAVAINAPSFNEDSAYYFVKMQTDCGPRVPETKAHAKCADLLVKEFKKYTSHVMIQTGKVRTFDGKDLNLKNIIASFQPEKTNRIFLSSHWDSRPFADQDPDEKNHKTPISGANDGASGVGILVEVARQLALKNPNIGVDIILFDAEDYGAPDWAKDQSDESWCLGSQFWAKNPHVAGYSARYGILLDMVGAPNARFTLEGTSMFFAPDVMKSVWGIADRSGYSDYFVNEETGSLTDDHLFINQIIKIPTIDIIHRTSETSHGFYPYWHTIKDDINCIDKTTLKAVGQTLLGVIYNES